MWSCTCCELEDDDAIVVVLELRDSVPPSVADRRGCSIPCVRHFACGGAFRLTRVPPGNYELIVNVPSNATPVPSQHLVVGANACIRRYIFSDPR